MAVLRLRDEADCLSSNRTEQSLRPHPSAGHRSKSPYRASGLVHRPISVSGAARKQTVRTAVADIPGVLYPQERPALIAREANGLIALIPTFARCVGALEVTDAVVGQNSALR